MVEGAFPFLGGSMRWLEDKNGLRDEEEAGRVKELEEKKKYIRCLP